ncbi:hypothetical protein O0I10_007648 [Lichtheimia ornata]|uniref:Short chain dehydrogenase n=1 Tax=Lichtheimia ornata TaxID=688661 RepID=A0AAD7XXL1_9FUNG|nr:uncharacterized protein O0I10_007648 [Lichtheimia ornata]KAJ8656571.1 hypothetical protein O0I10_007648 [Lichtheimia ornata]
MQRILLGLFVAALIRYYVATRHYKTRRRRLISAQGERVLLVGCSSGIGRELALQYASRGASLILIARRKKLLESLQKECENAGAIRVALLAGDITDSKFIIPQEEKEHGLDTVIYCAGAISVRHFMDACGYQIQKLDDGTIQVVEEGHEETMDGNVDEAMERITQVNFFGSVRLVRQVIPCLLTSSKAPNLILVSSLAGKIGAPTRALYAASKHALHGFFDSLRMELATYGMHIGVVCPGTVDTDLRKSAVDGHLGCGPITGSVNGKLSPTAVATRIIEASDYQEREVLMPRIGYLAVALRMITPSLIDWAASKKYQQ